MENIYDNEEFFQRYAEMSRSKYGLDGSADWPTLKSLLPDLKNINMLDIGCGYGWHCLYAQENGAKKVIGVDLSKKMINKALELDPLKLIDYRIGSFDDFSFDHESFDLVLSSLVLHYIEDYSSVVDKVHNILKKDGYFIFNVEHPTFTAAGSQDWFYDEKGKIKHFPVDNYYYEGEREANFLGVNVKKYHRTLTTYLMTIVNKGFTLESVIEARPKDSVVDTMIDEMRRPMMLIVKARKL